MSEARALRARVPGQSVMNQVVSQHQGREPRSSIARLFGASPLDVDDRAPYRGALGELLVGDALDHLGPAWDVLHAVPVGTDNYEIDHVAIGPPGVFSLLVSSDSGLEVIVDGDAMLIDGQPSDQIKTASFEAERAATLLSEAAERVVRVQPIVVIVNPKRLVIRNQPPGVVVLVSHNLQRWLTRLDRRLDGPEVAGISDVADRPATWQATHVVALDPAPIAAEDTARVRRDFAALRLEVTRATRRRALWAALAVIVVCGFTWISIAVMVSRIVQQ
jgi:hypothetical protein